MTVKPVVGQPFVFEVSSRSRPGVVHLVNWLRVDCSCETWAYKKREHKEATGKNYVCAHMEASRDHCWNEILEHTREQVGA